MSDHQQKDAIQAAREMTAAFRDVGEKVAANTAELEAEREERVAGQQFLTVYGRRNRILIRTTMASVILDIVLTVLVGVLYLVVHHNAATESDLHDALVAGCQANNVRLANQKKALDSVLTQTGTQHLTAAELRRRQEFLTQAEAYLAVGWAPKDCARAYLAGKP